MPTILDPLLVNKELEKPIELDREMKLLYGVQPDGSEKSTAYSLRDR